MGSSPMLLGLHKQREEDGKEEANSPNCLSLQYGVFLQAERFCFRFKEIKPFPRKTHLIMVQTI
jgi:hypothetical protein